MHITAFFGVIGNSGFALGGLDGTGGELQSVVWTFVIIAWLLSLGALLLELVRPVYETRYWYWTTIGLTGITSVGIIHLIYTSGSQEIFTDVILFMRYSADLVMQGQNPYTHSMLPALDRYSEVTSLPSVTQRADGSMVSNLSYPALSFLVFLPQRLLGISNISLTVVVFFALSMLILVREGPPWLFTVTITVLFFNQYLVTNSVFGNIDFVWIFLLLLGMGYWYRGQLLPAAFVVGLAFAVKPIVWFIGPYVAIWLWKVPEQFGRTRYSAITLSLVAGFIGFFLPNLPFILDAPSAWLFDVLSAAGSRVPFRTRGTGISLFAFANIVNIPTVGFRILLSGVLVSTLGLYYRYFESVKWVAWVMPAFLLWFNDRSLFNYFITFAPIAYYAILLNRRIVPKRPLIPSPKTLLQKIGGEQPDHSDQE